MQHALGIDDQHVRFPNPERGPESQAGDGGSPCSRHHHAHVFHPLAGELQAIEQRGGRNDRCPVLVVVEDWNRQSFTEASLDLEAFRRLDVLEIDPAQRRFERGDDVDQSIDVGLGQFDVKDVDAGKFLEQARFTFHHWLAGERANIAQAQYRSPVGNHAHQVGTRGVLGRERRIPFNFETGVGHSW